MKCPKCGGVLYRRLSRETNKLAWGCFRCYQIFLEDLLENLYELMHADDAATAALKTDWIALLEDLVEKRKKN